MSTGMVSIVRKLEQTITTALRMLDNVIDINYYAVPRSAQLQPASPSGRAGPDGLPGCPVHAGRIRIGPGSRVRRSFHGSGRLLCDQGSTDLAEERGRYTTFAAHCSQGILPIDSIALLRQECGRFLEVDARPTLTGTACMSACNASAYAIQLSGHRRVGVQDLDGFPAAAASETRWEPEAMHAELSWRPWR